MEFHRQLIHQHHLQSHLHCGNDPTVTNHNGTAAKDNSITNAATAKKSNLDATIYTAGTILQLQSTMEFHRQLIHQQHLQSHLHWGNDPRVANHNGNSIGNSSTSTTCNPIYIAGTILQVQITMEFCRPHMHETRVKHHLQCGTDPTMIRAWSEHDPTTHETVSHPSHRRGRSSRFGDGLCMEKHRVSCICYLSKTHFVRDFLQNSIGNSSTSNTCNPIYIEGTILELQITMEFCRPHMHETQVKPHLQCGTDPTMIRAWSEHDPTTHETVSHPSHRRGRSSRFGEGLCMEKHRASCICYLSKTHFVRDFLQKSNLKMSFTINSFPH